MDYANEQWLTKKWFFNIFIFLVTFMGQEADTSIVCVMICIQHHYTCIYKQIKSIPRNIFVFSLFQYTNVLFASCLLS